MKKIFLSTFIFIFVLGNTLYSITPKLSFAYKKEDVIDYVTKNEEMLKNNNDALKAYLTLFDFEVSDVANLKDALSKVKNEGLVYLNFDAEDLADYIKSARKEFCSSVEKGEFKIFIKGAIDGKFHLIPQSTEGAMEFSIRCQ